MQNYLFYKGTKVIVIDVAQLQILLCIYFCANVTEIASVFWSVIEWLELSCTLGSVCCSDAMLVRIHDQGFILEWRINICVIYVIYHWQAWS